MERFALGKSRLGMRWLVANYDILTNCLAVGGLCGPESGRLWKWGVRSCKRLVCAACGVAWRVGMFVGKMQPLRVVLHQQEKQHYG
jgi:hypothetical protein